MTSKNLKKLAADSNVILSAVIGKAALRVFLRSDIELVTTQFNIREVEEYIPRLAAKYGLDERSVLLQLKMLPIVVFQEKYYKPHIVAATRLLKGKDSDDIHLAALALKAEVPVLSNDKDFEKLPISAYPTAKLLKILDSQQ